jgi:putative tryptophan/tyrosine transport system substrate-binding protein
MMDRRHILKSTMAVVAVSNSARAQSRGRPPVIAILSDASEAVTMRRPSLTAMLSGLQEYGYQPGRNVQLEYRFADGDVTRLPALARELVTLRPDVFFTSGTPGALAAVAAAGGQIPIVVGPAGQITMSALVADYGRPDRNITGVTLEAPEQDSKIIELLKSGLPATRRIAVLVNPDNQVFVDFVQAMTRNTSHLGIELFEIGARNAAELPKALDDAKAMGADALIAANDGLLVGDAEIRRQIIAHALRLGIPAASTHGTFAHEGGLMSFGTDAAALGSRAAYLVHRILQGAHVAELPVERPMRIILSLNLKTARALGVTLPPAILLRADEVIE